jgi:hypothetical protein
MDDATGAIYSAFLVEEAGTASTSRALKEVFGVHGLPMSFYTDRGSHSFHTTKAGEIDRGHPTQVGRALAQLGVEPIGAFFLRRPAKARPSRPFPASTSTRSCAWRRGARSATTIACPTAR